MTPSCKKLSRADSVDSLAYCEMRLVLAKLLYYFGLEAADDYEGWTDQNVFFVWYKGPVRVKLHPVRKLSI